MLIEEENAFSATNYATTYNEPNKFVDQGYNNTRNWEMNQHNEQHHQQSRVVPIQLEAGHPYLNGPTSQTPHVIQR